jgi:hypothetical protein
LRELCARRNIAHKIADHIILQIYRTENIWEKVKRNMKLTAAQIEGIDNSSLENLQRRPQ